MLTEIRRRIVELVRDVPGLDWDDIATYLAIPTDIAYSEIDVLIDIDVLKREYSGSQAGLVVIGELDDDG